MDIKSLLLKTGLFSKLKQEELEQLLPSVETVKVRENEIFIKKGDPADALYVIETGVCQVFTEGESGHEIVLARLEAGAYFGEQALLTESPGRRNASVRAISDMSLLKVPHSHFQAVLVKDEALKTLLQQIGREQAQSHLVIENLHKVYISRKRGEIRQYYGKFLDQAAIISNFHLHDGREISATRVIDKNIHAIRDTHAKPSQEIIYENENIHRELLLENHCLVGIISYGPWANLSQIINMIFNQTPLDQEQIAHFASQGELVLVLPESPALAAAPDEIICNCMAVSLGQIREQIKAGATDVDAIGDLTGAGTVCGTCRPKIQDLLGHETWQAVRIKKILPLTSYIHAYQLIPALGESLQPYKAGQFVVLQCFIDGNWVNRAYTLTSRTMGMDYYEIAIQREDGGLFSTWIFGHENEIPLLRISAPDGKFTPDFNSSLPMICLMAGIGITPALAFARAAFHQKSQRPIYIYFSAHTESDFAYLSEFKKIAELHAPVKLITRATQVEGRLGEKELLELRAQFPDAEYFICGPTPFETSMQSILKKLEISESKIFVEKFTHSYDPA